ncbi:hypothetical protein ABZU76_40425 [Amycolatopsis sp. NPDC005232]|uniref:hypothetical protein n=1 Tax=Amycolatopsis sp. NPDC005232 TaxID=3157027 RepID=UPI0033B7BA02
MRVRSAVVLGAFTLVAAGCTTGGHALPAPLPPVPAAARALVAWSQTVCTSVQALQGLQAGIDEVNHTAADPSQADFLPSEISSYVSGITGRIGQAGSGLKSVPPSGVKAADTYVAQLGKSLDEVTKKAPPDTTAQPTLAQARELATAVAALKPAAADLTRAVRGDAKLNASYNVAPACAPLRQFGPLDAAAPTRPLVAWADTMCGAVTATAALKAHKIEDLVITDPRYARLSGFDLSSFISSAGSGVARLVETLGTVTPSGIPAADKYHDSLLAALRAVAPKLPSSDSRMPDLDFQPVEQLKPQAQQIIGVLATIALPTPDLPTIAAANPVLAHSHDVAPQCRPLGSPPPTLPPAANGTDLGACAGGKCQVLVTGQADITASGMTFTASVTSSGVRILQDSGEMSFGVGGSGSFGMAGHMVTVRLSGVLDGKAVLDISTG